MIISSVSFKTKLYFLIHPLIEPLPPTLLTYVLQWNITRLVLGQLTTLDIGYFGVNTKPVLLDGTHTEEQLQKYAGMQSLIKASVDNAEAIKDRLQQILLNHTKPIVEERRLEIMKMDFMALKQWFMDDIRSSKIYQQFEKYNSTKKLKPFSQGFNTFILDRNKYTHGQLCFLRPDLTFVIEYVETPSQKKRYAHIEADILVSYNNFYKEIIDVITEYNVIHQTKTIGDYKMKNNLVD